MLRKVQWSGFPIIANLFKGKLLHCEGASSRGGCRPSGCLAGHVVLRLSWLLHLPGPGFKLQAHTCRGPSAISQKDEGKIGFRCLLARLCSLWGPRLHMRAELDLVTGTSGLPLWLGPTRGFCENGVLPAHPCHQNCVSSLVWEYSMEEKESTITQGYPVAALQATSRAPRGLKGEPPLLHMLGCAQPRRQMKKHGHQQLCALAGIL